MTASVSYRFEEDLKGRLAARAAAEGITETMLVSRLLDEGLETTAHPGIVYRSGPMGRRAAIAGGPDVWQVVVAARHAPGQGESKVVDVAEQLSLEAHAVRLAIDFAATHPEETERLIDANATAAEDARRLAEQRERLIAS